VSPRGEWGHAYPRRVFAKSPSLQSASVSARKRHCAGDRQFVPGSDP
jgi:hypothetical protein